MLHSPSGTVARPFSLNWISLSVAHMDLLRSPSHMYLTPSLNLTSEIIWFTVHWFLFYCPGFYLSFPSRSISNYLRRKYLDTGLYVLTWLLFSWFISIYSKFVPNYWMNLFLPLLRMSMPFGLWHGVIPICVIIQVQNKCHFSTAIPSIVSVTGFSHFPLPLVLRVIVLCTFLILS